MNIKNTRIIISAICMLLLLCACSSGTEKGKKKVMGKAQSAPYELLVVADKEWLKTPAGVALMDVVQAPIDGLPQYESHFRVTSINPAAMNATFKTYAMIVSAEVSPKHKEPLFEVAKDVYCRNQLMIKVSAPDDATLIQYLNDYRDAMLAMLDEHEFARERDLLSRNYSGQVEMQGHQMFAVRMKAPRDIDDVKVGKKFFWASASKQEFKLNICMYSLPLQELSIEEFVAKRDSVMQINIPGGREDQWMETDARSVTCSEVSFRDKKVLAVRGLWDMKNDAMGGPFVSYLYPDEKCNRIIVAEAFVFAPNEKKRPLIRELEAALQTLEMNPRL